MDRERVGLGGRQFYTLYDRACGHDKTMTLLELTEPLFQYVCRLNRIARRGPSAKPGDTSFISKTAVGAAAAARGISLDDVVARSEIKALLEDMMSKAST